MRRATRIAIVTALATLWAGATSAGAVSPGQPDTGFGPGTVAGVSLLGIGVQGDGSVAAVGTSGQHGELVRFNSAGALISTSQTAGSVARGLAIQSDRKIVVVGGDATTGEPMFVERFNADGTVDDGFGSHGVVTAFGGTQSQANAVAMQGNEIVVAGTAPIPSGGSQGYPGVALLRLGPAGNLHTSEVVDLGRFSVANSVAVQSDGKIVVAGSQRNGLQSTDLLAARFTPGGALDSSFNGNGLFLHGYANQGAYSEANGVALQSDGKVVLAGDAFNGAVGVDTLIVRLTSGGAQDSSFGSGGVVRLPATANNTQFTQQQPLPGARGVIVSGGKIVAAGDYDSFGSQQLALWALAPDGSLDSGFGSGGRVLGSVGVANAIAAGPGSTIVIAGQSSGGGLVARYGAPVPIATPPPSPPPSPPPPSPPPPSPGPTKLHVSLSLGSTFNLKSILSSGLMVPLQCNEVCRVQITLTIPYATAVALHLVHPTHHHPRTVQIGSLTVTLHRSKHKYLLVLRLTRAARNAFARQRLVLVTFNLRITAGKQVDTVSRTLKLKHS